MIVTNYNAQGEEIKLEEITLSDELNERILKIIERSNAEEAEHGGKNKTKLLHS